MACLPIRPTFVQSPEPLNIKVHITRINGLLGYLKPKTPCTRPSTFKKGLGTLQTESVTLTEIFLYKFILPK